MAAKSGRPVSPHFSPAPKGVSFVKSAQMGIGLKSRNSESFHYSKFFSNETS